MFLPWIRIHIEKQSESIVILKSNLILDPYSAKNLVTELYSIYLDPKHCSCWVFKNFSILMKVATDTSLVEDVDASPTDSVPKVCA